MCALWQGRSDSQNQIHKLSRVIYSSKQNDRGQISSLVKWNLVRVITSNPRVGALWRRKATCAKRKTRDRETRGIHYNNLVKLSSTTGANYLFKCMQIGFGNTAPIFEYSFDLSMLSNDSGWYAALDLVTINKPRWWACARAAYHQKRFCFVSWLLPEFRCRCWTRN